MSSSSASPNRQLLRLVGGSAFIFACRVGGAGITFVTQVLMARWMGAAELGVYVVAFSCCILAATVSTGGFAAAAIRFIGAGLAAQDLGRVAGFARHGRSVSIVGSLAVALLGATALLAAGDVVPAANRVPLLLAMAAVPFLANLTFSSGVANAFLWLPQAFLPNNIIRPLGFLAVLSLLTVLPGTASLKATAAMLAQLLVAAVVSVVTAAVLGRRLRAIVGAVQPVNEWQTWTRASLPLVGVTIFTTYMPEILVVMASLHLPSDQIAILQVGYRIALLIAFGLYAVDSYTAPETARLLATTERTELARLVNRVTRLRFWTAFAAVLGVAALGHQVLGLFGREFVAGYTVLLIVALGQLPQAAVGPALRLLSVSGHQDEALAASLGALGGLLLFVTVLAPPFGMTGVAVAALLAMMLWSAWMWYLVARHLGIRASIF